MLDFIKKLVIRGLPDSVRFRYLAYKPKFRTWLKGRSEDYPIFPDRYKLYDYVNDVIVGNNAIDYLEFGVYKGETIRYWCSINSNVHSRFAGFDTFTGLPEAWNNFSYNLPKNAFDTGGALPEIDDNRVTLVKGMFQETLPGFISDFSPGGQLIIHNDSDIYSATLYVLSCLNAYLKDGAIVIFDEFYFVLDEFRALEDYCNAYLRHYELIAATDGHAQIAVRF